MDQAHLNALAVCGCLALLAFAANQAVSALMKFFGAEEPSDV